MNYIKRTTIVSVFLLISVFAYAGDYEKAWEALHQNDKPLAYTLFKKVLQNDPAHKSNALAALIFLDTYDGGQSEFMAKYPAPADIFADVNAYSYAFWFYDALLGEYDKKEGRQLNNLNRIISDNRYNGSMKAAASYYKGLHYVYCQQKDSARASYDRVDALLDWDFVGPFDNIRGSGFNKEYGPVHQPARGEGFNSYNNTNIDWFTPLYTNKEGWIFIGSLFPTTTAVSYAQAFVNSPIEQDVILGLGTTGSIKAWMNDKLLISKDEEAITELDQYKVHCHLNKGYNRILLQVGFTGGNSLPSFIVRLTDNNYQAIKGISETNVQQSYTINKDTSKVVPVTHFAEAYFKAQIAKYPQDPIFPCLLSRVYIRNQNYDDAKAVMFNLAKKFPSDPLIQYQYLESLSDIYNKTASSELLEKIKLLDPDNYMVLQIKEAQLVKEKKYVEALDMVKKMEAKSGVGMWSQGQKILLYGNLQKADSMIQVLKDTYERFPQDQMVVRVMMQYHEQMLKDPSGGVKILEKYLEKKYNYEVTKQLMEAYFKQNQPEKGEAVLRSIVNGARYDVFTWDLLVNYFYARQKYDSAITYLQIEHQISPYSSTPLGTIANCYLQKGDKKQALEYYKKALALNKGAYTFREKIRELESKPDVFSYFPQQDDYAIINKNLKTPQDSSKGYYFLFDDKRVVLYAEGASETQTSTAVYLNNKDGIEQWKQFSIPYNDSYQDLTIIKAEVVKANGSKIPAETEQNQVVFTSLDPGDVVYYIYKINSFGIGRLGREFWDKYYFSVSAPALLARYSVLVADQLPLYYQLTNGNGMKPVESKKENFRLYTWEMKNVPTFKFEDYSQGLSDIGQVLHVSTVNSWDVIAEWYSDITRMQSKEDFDINNAYAEIFPDGIAGLSDEDKAKRIYSYIEKYISYSSLSFRQGAYVPQRASVTLNTRLGDCKDLSALFVSFARKAGMDANLILVSTRNNGHSMLLPSMEFNHCIVRFRNGDNYRYLELTDNQLPFNSMPQSLVGAQVLNIPYVYQPGQKIELLHPVNRFEVTKSRKVKIVVDNADIHVTIHTVSDGRLAGGVRSDYANKGKDEQKESLQDAISRQFKNPVKLETFKYTNLDVLADSVILDATYTVKNEVISVGDMNMMKPPFLDVVATSGIFNGKPRKTPFEYWKYEDIDRYIAEVEVDLPAGKTFDQIPSNLEASFKNMKYTLTYQKLAADRLLVKRTFFTDTQEEIKPEEFDKMKEFFSLILGAEQKYVSFK